MIPLGVLASSCVAPAGGSLSLSFLGATSGTGSTLQVPVVFSGVSLGPADASRTIVLAVSMRAGFAPDHTAASIAGVTATRDAYAVDGVHAVSIWHAAVPTGTTGTISVTQDTAFPFWTGIALWSITGASVSVADFATSDADPAPLSVDVSSGDLIVAAVSVDANNGITWANATERYETAISSASSTRIMGGADATAATTGTLAVSADYGTHTAAAGASVAYTGA